MDFSEIKGQEHVKRAVEVTLAGNHNMLITGGRPEHMAEAIQYRNRSNG